MAVRSLASVTNPQLFELCATHPQHDEYWAEFVHRFNPLLVRSITVAWRRNGQGDWPPQDVAADLLQDVYANIVKGDFRLLRNFRGASDAEAEAYLAHAALNQTVSFLRQRHAQRRHAPEIPLDDWLHEHGDHHHATPLRRAGVSESELLGILKKCFAGPNAKRDILIFLLYARDGFSVAEIAGLGVAELKETSIANLLGQMKIRLKKYLTEPV